MTGHDIIKQLREMEQKAKPTPWYAWLKPHFRVEDSCITRIPLDQFAAEYEAAEQFNQELRERIGRNTPTDKWRYRSLSCDEEVIGCSEWLRAENDDLTFIAESRNAMDLLLSIAEAFRPGDAKMLRDLVIFFSEMEKGGIPSDEIMVHLWNNHQSMKECMVRLQAAAEKLE